MKCIVILICLISFNLVANETKNIEHQLRLCDSSNHILNSLNLNNTGPREFNLYFIETPNKDYETNKWSIRIRFKSNKTEITVKKKSFELEQLDKIYSGMICEYDQHGSVSEYGCKLNADISNNDFDRVIKNKANWTEILSKQQYKLLNDHQMILPNSKVVGFLKNYRYQWDDHFFGTITLDLIHLPNNEDVSFNEISIRYLQNSNVLMGKKFDQLIQSVHINLCTNQVDWEVDKFDLLNVLN